MIANASAAIIFLEVSVNLSFSIAPCINKVMIDIPKAKIGI